MEKSAKIYPDWVQAFRKKGTAIKKKGNSYYLYTRTSRRVPGKKYPQPVDVYEGVITPQGIIRKGSRKASISPMQGGSESERGTGSGSRTPDLPPDAESSNQEAEVMEYGFSRAVLDLCPKKWKKSVGDDWEAVLNGIIIEWSPNSYLTQEAGSQRDEKREEKPSDDQTASLLRRIRKKYDLDLQDLSPLKTVYLVRLGNRTFLSKTDAEQRALLDRLGISLVSPRTT